MEVLGFLLCSKDSMGNLEILKRGDLQMTSAGTGITHSEYNRNVEKVCVIHSFNFLLEAHQWSPLSLASSLPPDMGDSRHLSLDSQILHSVCYHSLTHIS